MVMMFIVAVLPTRKKESQSYFNCGRRAVQFHLVVVVVSPLNALDQIDAKKHKNASRKTYSFLEVKLRQSSKKSWTKIKLNKCDIRATHCQTCKQS